MKLLYTRKDRIDLIQESYKTCLEISEYPFDPFTNIEVNRGKEAIEEEQATQDYIIEGFGLNFAMGHIGLMSVTFLKDDVQICPAIGEGIVGDGQTIQIQECIQMTKGEIIKVKVRNTDKKYDHIVGVRVDVKETK